MMTYLRRRNARYRYLSSKIKEHDVVDDLLLILQLGEENESILDERVELHICLGVRYWQHTLLNFGRIIFKSTNFRRNNNFHLWRIGTINFRTWKNDQKIKRVLHEIAKAKLSVCCLQEVRRFNNNSVIISNKQNNVEQK